ncbi:methyltransferase domain-containing protein [Shimia sp. SDUM112013]|uniref:methyltransferase domain-containing protein n=1 Tax=Shimia sp. SDUM112013 TaxID=3136160 RepID=UPI0032ECA6F0
MNDWNPQSYGRFADVRLQPALDLLGAVQGLPDGGVVDLGCGSGAVAPALRHRWPARPMVGVDDSAAMLARAQAAGTYDRIEQADIAHWQAEVPPALIYSNAALQWVPEHLRLIPALVGQLAPEGTLAVQMPMQHAAPSHLAWAEAERAVYGTARTQTALHVLLPEGYFDLLSPLGTLRLWQTEYLQHLPAADGAHPVRLFTESTFGKPFLDAAKPDEKAQLIAAYERAMAKAYPVRADGTVLFPFRRLFFTLRLDQG